VLKSVIIEKKNNQRNRQQNWITMLFMQRTSCNIFAIAVAVLICSAKGQKSPSGVTFNIADGDRVAAKTGVQATFTFTPSAGGAGPASVTLN
jgi:hypothetical protein